MRYRVAPLEPATWPDFADLVDRNDGVWGGCWCMGFHPEGVGRLKTVAQNRAEKEERVRMGQAHAALVYDRDTCVGWCQFGSPDELPRIKCLKAYTSRAEALPDWRITCFFTDKRRRGQGIASAALSGALDEIATLGGGSVEAYPEDVAGRNVAGAFLHGGRLGMFEDRGFRRDRKIGLHRWVVAKVIV